MSDNAAHRVRVNLRLTALLAAAMLLAAFAGTASAAPLVGHDGKLHACYKVKGKPKGILRVVPGNAKHKKCKRGERKVSWTVLGAAGPAGQAGAAGAPGAPGEAGEQGEPGGIDPTLAAQITALSQRVDSLESVLAGITNEDLRDAIGLVPVVDSLCTQTSELTTTLDLLNTAVGGLSLNGALTILGGVLNIPTLPATLGAYSCPGGS